MQNIVLIKRVVRLLLPIVGVAALVFIAYTSVQIGRATGHATTTDSTTTVFAVVLVEPQDGASVSGLVDLHAQVVSGIAQSVMFDVVDLSGIDPNVTLPATVDSTGMLWSTPFDTSTLSDGQKQITMTAYDGLGATVSDVRLIYVQNGVSLSIITPATDSVLSDVTTLTATSSVAVGSVAFDFYQDVGGTLSLAYSEASQTDPFGNSWEAPWDSTELADGTYYLVASTQVSGVSYASEYRSVRIQNKTEDPLTVVLTYPVSGDVLDGNVTLEADAPEDATTVHFNISWTDSTTGITNTGSPSGGGFSLAGSYDMNIKKWFVSWDTRSNDDRDYQVSVTAIRGTETVVSAAVTVTVMNGSGETLTVTVTSPLSGTVVTGSLVLHATSSSSLQDLSFSIDSIASLTSGPIVVSANGSADGTQWEATWDSNEVPNGGYSVVPRSAAFGAQDLGMPVSFSVDNTVTSVQLIVPQEGQELSGTVSFSLVTPSDVESARFLVEQGDISESVDAQFDSGSSTWNAVFDTTVIEDGDYKVIGETMLSGQTFRSAAMSVSITNGTAGESTGSVMLLSPTDGMTLIGEVSFQASVDRSVTSLSFFVAASSTASSFLQRVSANFDGSSGVWTAKWQSGAALNGSYDVTAVAVISDGSEIGSERASVVIQNDATEDGTDIPDADTTTIEAVMSIRIISPQSGPVEGKIYLVAVTEGAVQDVVFIIRRSGETVDLGRRPAERNGDEWRGALETGNLGEGNFTLVAVANEAADRLVSNAVDISLPGVVVAVGTDGEDVSDIGEDQTPVLVPLSVTVTYPAPGDVSGITRLSAQTVGSAVAVEFRITRLGAAVPTVTRAALFVQKSGQWSALWDTIKVDTGEYVIRAFARRQDDTEAASIPLAVKVDNISVAETDIVDVIDTEIVMGMVKELPEGTMPIIETLEGLPTRPVIADIVMQTIERKVHDECTENGIPEDRCEPWFAKRYRSDECSAKGIVTREDCIAYLKVLHGGQVPGCQGKSAPDCAEVETRLTTSLLSEEVFKKIEDAVVERINTVIRLEIGENDEVTAVPIDDIEEELAEEFIKNIPLRPKRQQRIAIRVHASPSFAKLTDTTSTRRIPAVLIIDSDGDGLPDDLERRLGTDPTNADTDGDGFSDHTEVKNGFNPLGSGMLDKEKALAPIDRAIVAGIPIEHPTEAGDVDTSLTIEVVIKADDDTQGPDIDDTGEVDEVEALVFTGTGTPGDTVTIFVYSYLPVILTTTVGEDGTWTYALDSQLEDGQHAAFVTVTDDTGKIRSKSDPLAFFISEAQAITEDNFYGSVNTIELATEPINRLYWWYAVGAFALVLVGLVLGVLIFSKPSGRSDDGPAFS